MSKMRIADYCEKLSTSIIVSAGSVVNVNN